MTVGVEEEYLVVDPVSRQVSPEAEKVVALAAAKLGERVTTEFTCYQVEVRTDPHTSLTRLGDQLRSTRAVVSRAAARLGLAVISSGTPVLGQRTPPPITPGDRYAQSVATYGALDHEQTVCAAHVHIGVPDETTAVQLSNHLRPWLPALIAMTANSPYWDGQDTGYASWRTTTWGRWPVAGPPPYFTSRDHFQTLVDTLVTSGTVMDRGSLYWDIRPSHHVPTLEVRIADALPTVTDTVLLAGVIKGLAATAFTAIRRSQPAPKPGSEILRAACWRAAHDGLAGDTINLRTGRLEPAAVLNKRLADTVRAALGAADLASLQAAQRHLLTHGNGADRQRAAYRQRRHLPDVVDHLIHSMTALDYCRHSVSDRQDASDAPCLLPPHTHHSNGPT
ncbi:glutamate--cysteine ligase [Streptomyces fodineus]|uniref:Putative glutamate--cysteine ligase 2 n=1 Tax=Streptomyces fodineus TaxID=1904616 RepID=A0A1D7Y2M8_9ACTN|nr:glutamate--cysteine ligase [Streptomyces fodineus]